MKFTALAAHIVFWLWYTMGVVWLPDPQLLGDLSYGEFLLKQASLYSIFIGYFYYVYILLVPKFVQKRNLVSSLNFVALCLIGVVVGLGLLLGHGVFVEHLLNKPGFTQLRIDNISYFPSQFILFTIAGILFRLAVDWFSERGRVESLERERQESELAMLRGQIAPHFLFNSLNNIYSLMRSNTAKAGEAVMSLAELMRYAISRESGTTTLLDEFSHLNNFVLLQQLRLTDSCTVEVDLPSPLSSLTIEPLLLISFVENAFKHTDVSADNAHIHIKASVEPESTLIFEVVNSPAVASDEQSHGIGLRNVQRRLQLVYPGRHELRITSGQTFSAHLQVQL